METGAISHSAIDVTLTDNSGGRLPGVIGVLTGSIIGQRDEVSNANGHMVFRDLPPGTYQLVFSLEGFKDARREDTIHGDGEVDPIKLTMELAQV